jgi:hypothetical protein
MLLEGVKHSSFSEMLWESVPSKKPGESECPFTGGGQLDAG